MKGYFSRLAKQSGLSFPGQRSTLSAGAAKGDPAPPHREETIMMPPLPPPPRASDPVSVPVSKAAGKIGPGPARETDVPEKTKRGATPSAPPPGISPPGEDPLTAAGGSISEIEAARVESSAEKLEIVELREKLETGGKETLVRKETHGAEESSEEKRIVTLPADAGGKPPRPSGEKSPAASRETFERETFERGTLEEGPQEISVIEQTVFIPPGAPVEILPESRADAAAPVVPLAEETIEISAAEEPEGVEENKAAEQAKRQKYFSKTAEIILKPEPDAAGLQNILFQELREWAAGDATAPTGAPTPTPTQAVTAVTGATAEQRETEKQAGLDAHTEILQMEREPAVVTIKEKETFENNESSGGSSEASSGLAEQSFDLSIGTINVIIEDAAPLPQPERPSRNESAGNNSPETKREYSRLSRNYL